MKRVFLVLFLILITTTIYSEDLTGCWVIRQNQGQVRVTKAEDCYKFVKESFYRGEITIRSGLLRCDNCMGTVIYKNGLKTRIKKTGKDCLCENNIEDWVKVSDSYASESFNINGTWKSAEERVVFSQSGSRVTGKKYQRNKLISQYNGVIKEHMISLKEHYISGKRPDSYHRMAVMDKNKILLNFGWTGDTYLTKQ